MKRMIYLTAAISLVLSSCTLETSDNGDFDGFWHLERVDTLATGNYLDLSRERVFWGVQHKLISCASITPTNMYSFRGYYFRFEEKGDSLILHSPYKNNWHQDHGENGGIRERKRLDKLVHSSWFPLAQHVLCERISAVMQPHNSCCAAGDINFSENRY